MNVLQWLKDKKSLSDRILSTYQKLQAKDIEWSTTQIDEMNRQMNGWDEEYQLVNQAYTSYVSQKLSWLKEEFPEIFEMITDRDPPPSRETLEHVLDAFCQSHSGKINKKEAVSRGLKYMQKQYNLPSDFFDHSKIDQFIQG